jgi:hypothetical protein
MLGQELLKYKTTKPDLGYYLTIPTKIEILRSLEVPQDE